MLPGLQSLTDIADGEAKSPPESREKILCAEFLQTQVSE